MGTTCRLGASTTTSSVHSAQRGVTAANAGIASNRTSSTAASAGPSWPMRSRGSRARSVGRRGISWRRSRTQSQTNAIAALILRSDGGAETYLEMILAYVEGAVSAWCVYLQGPEANMCLRAFFTFLDDFACVFAFSDDFACVFYKLAWLTGSRRQNATYTGVPSTFAPVPGKHAVTLFFGQCDR